MKRLTVSALAALAAAGLSFPSALAAPILRPGDTILAIDLDGGALPVISESNYPAGESPDLALDNDVFTKYLNFGEETSGIIVTPAAGSSIAKSLVIGTANDGVERDPTSFNVWGTNSAILALDNDEGETGEVWTLIKSGALALPDDRQVFAPVVSFAENTTGYTSYRINFPTVKNAAAANSMQVSEIGLFASADGTGDSLLAFNPALAWRLTPPSETPGSLYPANESTPLAIDGVPDTKYLNFGGNNSGFIVTPQEGATTVTSFRIRTANDAPERDPISYELFGSNAAIVSADHSDGNGGEAWTSIQAGVITLPAERFTAGDVVPVTNTTAYTSYRLVFTEVNGAPLMQIGDVQFFDATAVTPADANGDFDADGDVDGADFLRWQRGLGQPDGFYVGTGDANLDGTVTDADLAIWKAQYGPGAAVAAAGAVPEPQTAALAALGLLAAAAARRDQASRGRKQ